MLLSAFHYSTPYTGGWWYQEDGRNGKRKEGNGVFSLPQIIVYEASIKEHTLKIYMHRKAIHQLHLAILQTLKAFFLLIKVYSVTICDYFLGLGSITESKGFILVSTRTNPIPFLDVLSLLGQVRGCSPLIS